MKSRQMQDRTDTLSESALQDTQIESNEITKNEHYQDAGPTASTAGEPYQTGWRLALIIFPLCLGTLLVAIDNTIIAVAIPKISSTFKALDQVAWYGSGYLLTVTAFQPTFGKLYKYFNVKLTYLVSIVVFEGKPHPVPLGSVLCAAASNSSVFIFGRAVAGLGAAGLFQGALCIIGLSVVLERRPLFLGAVVSAFGLATCFGPVLGGALTSGATWRWCFWINVPIGAVDFFLILTCLNLRRRKNEDRSTSLRVKITNMDPFGATTLIAAVCCLLLALQWGGTTYPWNSARVISLFVIFGLSLMVFCLLQWKLNEKGTVPPRILGQRSVLMGCCYTFLLSMANYTAGYYVPFYFQAVQGASAMDSGIRFIPLAFPEVFAILLTGFICNRTGHYVPFMVIGAVVSAIGVGLLTIISINTPTVRWAAYLVIAGLGLGFGINIPYTALQVVLNDDDLPIGNAVTVFFTQLGGAVSLPIANSVFIGGLKAAILKRKTAITPQVVINAGPTNLRTLTQDPNVLYVLQLAYLQAVKNSLYLALAAVSIALFFGVSMEWKRMKVGVKSISHEDDPVVLEPKIFAASDKRPLKIEQGS